MPGNRIKTLKDAVQQAIDNGARSVEEVYMRLSKMSFDQLERIAALEGIVKRARGVHDQSVGTIYSTIRRMNQRIGKLADEMLRRMGAIPRTRRRRARPRRRKAAA